MKFDIIIVGGGTSGCATAYTASKLGLSTLLIEKNSFLGGTMTGALVTPAMKSSENQINTVFFKAFINELQILGGQTTYIDGNQGWFNPELGKIALDRLMCRAGVKVLFNAQINEIVTENDIIKSVKVSSFSKITRKILSEHIETNYSCEHKVLSEDIETTHIIDATGKQELCHALNCDFIDDNSKMQPSSLRFILSGVNLVELKEFILNLDPDRSATTASDINGEIHLSTACTADREWALTPIFNKGINKGVLKPEDMGYFQIFTIPGMPSSVAFNCPRFTQTADNNDLDIVSNNLISARESILRYLEFCRHFLPGFQKSYISNIAPLIGERVSQRALGKYLYTMEDLKSGKTFANPILISNYPIDVHSNNKSETKLEMVLQEYQLPVEALCSKNYKNLYFVGRSISADFYAQAALRIIPSCFSMGEGLAKYLAKLSN